ETEQLVADGAADEIRVEPQRADVVLYGLHGAAQSVSATASISTSAPEGSFATWNVERAGGALPTCRAYTSFIPAKSSRLCRNTVVFTIRSSELPAASRIARRLANTCSVCSAMPPGTSWLSPGRSASWPETKTR